MPYVLPTGRRVGPEMAFSLGEGDALIQYPRNWLKFSTEAERTARGITWEADPAAPEPPPRVITVDDVATERTRRLALGFDYNFNDVRGIHRIGTTEADMRGWDEVTTIANAAINLSLPNTVINVVTDTGPAAITALEWQSILLAAAAFRQPLWAKSFLLQAMSPIPSDFTSDSYWS